MSKENHCKLYPPCKKEIQAKNRCYPSRTAISITKNNIEVHLQALLDHTVESILFLQGDVIRSSAEENVRNTDLICIKMQIDCDGSSG